MKNSRHSRESGNLVEKVYILDSRLRGNDAVGVYL
jgi:hypothetical protein